MPPIKGDSSQLKKIDATTNQSTTLVPTAASPAPSTPPTMACVVDTGAPKYVARCTHSAEASSADIMIHTNVSAFGTRAGSMMPLEIVSTTSLPAISAPAHSKTAAMMSAPDMVSARAPTAGPTLLATSLAPMVSAM